MSSLSKAGRTAVISVVARMLNIQARKALLAQSVLIMAYSRYRRWRWPSWCSITLQIPKPKGMDV